MTRLVKVVSLATAMACGLMGAVSSAQAQSNNDPLSLKIANAISPDRFFIRAGVIAAKVKTESDDTFDVTSVLSKADLNTLLTTDAIKNYVLALGAGYTEVQANGVQGRLRSSNGIPLILGAMDRPSIDIDALGTPRGIKAIAEENIGTAGLSLGYFLDDEYKWVVEAYVLAKPITASVSVTKPGTWYQFEDEEGNIGVRYRPFGLEGQKILSSKMLPPTVMLGRYWGDKNSKFRPYTGLVAMYAMFYDVKVSDALNTYQGGKNPGDTTASLKNTFGIGPMLGIKYQVDDAWHVNLNIGSVKLKAQGTITTRNSSFNINTPAILDYGNETEQGALDDESIYNVAVTGENNYSDPNPAGNATNHNIYKLGGVTSVVTGAAAYARTGSLNPSYVRKANTTLTTTIFMLSVGRSF